MWVVYALFSAFFAGITAILAKIGIRDTDSHLATALRTIVVLFFAWLMVFAVGSQDTIVDIKPYSMIFLLLSGISTGASWICYFKALQLGDVNKVVPIDKLSTVLTMLLAFLFLGESITFNKIVGMCAILTGTFMMIKKETTKVNSKSNYKWFFYACFSAIFASMTSILGKIGIQDIESNLGTAIRTVVVLIMAWAIVLAQGKQRDISKIDKKSWVFILLSGITTGLSWLFYYSALKYGQASIVVPIDKLSVVVTTFFAHTFLKEKLSKKTIIGLSAIVIGTILLIVKH
ncbi:MAG: EamA family transporter [Oscillospiraceae bacterium]